MFRKIGRMKKISCCPKISFPLRANSDHQVGPSFLHPCASSQDIYPGLFTNPEFLLLPTCTEQEISLSHFAFRAHFSTNSTCPRVTGRSCLCQQRSGSHSSDPIGVPEYLWKKARNVDEKMDQTGNFTPEAAFPAFQKRIPSNSASVLWTRDHKKKS